MFFACSGDHSVGPGKDNFPGTVIAYCKGTISLRAGAIVQQVDTGLAHIQE